MEGIENTFGNRRIGCYSIVRSNLNSLLSATYAAIRSCSTRSRCPLRHQSRRGLSGNSMLRLLLEIQLQRYLHGTCSAQLIDGAEPAELAGERCVRLAKERPVVQ